jgi:hypothetical protein
MPIVMIEQPNMPAGDVVETIEAAMAWLNNAIS